MPPSDESATRGTIDSPATEIERLRHKLQEKAQQRDTLAEFGEDAEAAVGSLDVEIEALQERIDGMSDRKPREPRKARESDEERLARALQQSRLEHSQREQSRLDLATSASLGASPQPQRAPASVCACRRAVSAPFSPAAHSRMFRGAETSRNEAEQDIISVPPNFGEIMSEDDLSAIGRDTMVALRLGPPTQDGNDAFLVLEGAVPGIDTAKALLQPHIDAARAAQRDQSPELQKLLGMGFLREEAERALLDENGDVQRAVNRLTGDDEPSPRARPRMDTGEGSYDVEIVGLWCGKLLVEPSTTLAGFRAELAEKTGAPVLVLTIEGRELMDEAAALQDCGVVPGARVTCRSMLSPKAKQDKQRQEEDELKALEQWGSGMNLTVEPEPEPEPLAQQAGWTHSDLTMSDLIDATVDEFPDPLRRLRSRAYTGETLEKQPEPESVGTPSQPAEADRLSRHRSPGWVRARNQFPRKCTWGEWTFCIHVCDPPVGARLSLNHPAGGFLNLSQGSIGDFSWKWNAEGSTDLVSSSAAAGASTEPWLDVTLVDRTAQTQRLHTAVAGENEFYDLGSGWLTSAQSLQTSMLDGEPLELAPSSDYVFGMRSQWTLSHNGTALSIRNAHAGTIPGVLGMTDLQLSSTEPLDALAARMFCIKLGADGTAYFFDTTGERHEMSETSYKRAIATSSSLDEPFEGALGSEASPRKSSLPSLMANELPALHPGAALTPSLLASPTSPFSGDDDDDQVPSSLARLITTQEKDRSDLEMLVGSCPSPSRFGSADSRLSNDDLELRLSTGESVRERVGSLPLNLEEAFFGSDLIPTPTKQASLSGSGMLGSGVLIPPDMDGELEGGDIILSPHAPSDDSDDGMFVMSPTEQSAQDPWLVPKRPDDEEVVLQIEREDELGDNGEDDEDPTTPEAVSSERSQRRKQFASKGFSGSGGGSFMMTPSPVIEGEDEGPESIRYRPDSARLLLDGSRTQPEVEPEPEPEPMPMPVQDVVPQQQRARANSSPEPPSQPQFVKELPSSFTNAVKVPAAASASPPIPMQSTMGVGTSWLDVGASMAHDRRHADEPMRPELQPKKRFVREGNPVRLMDVEATQGTMMFVVQSILDTRIAFDRISLAVPRPGEESAGRSPGVVCSAQNKEIGGQAHYDSSLVTRLYGEMIANFRFRTPPPAVDCLRAVSAVREAIETDVGSPIGFRILIQRPAREEVGTPQDLERWYIVLDHRHDCVTADSSKRRYNKLVKDAVVSMRSFHQFVRLVPGYNQFRSVVPRGGGRTTKPSLEFTIERINLRDVPSQTMRATSLETPFGVISVSLEFDLACEVLLPTPRPIPVQAPPPLSTSPPPLSSSPPQVDSTSSEMNTSFPASSLPDVPSSDQPLAVPASGFDSWSPGVTPGHKNPGDSVGEYKLEEQLGAGQYGRVFRATTIPADGSDPVRVAIKSIDRSSLCDMGGNMDEKKKSYVESEIRVMQSVNHPNIVRLFEPLYSETNIFLVLEFCDLDLSKYLNGNKFSKPQVRPRAPLAEAEAQLFMRHLAAGLQNLRHHNVVHRDLKPENLLLSGTRETGFTLKIADFGMARTLEGAQQLANTMCGSPAFMAPEVFLLRQQGQPGYDEKADLWSVGCILYFMLTKNMVTPAQNHMHLAQELQVRGTPTQTRLVCRGVYPSVCGLSAGALEPDIACCVVWCVPQTAAEKEHREGGRCVRELLPKYKVQQEAVGTLKDFKPVADEATGEQKESVRRLLAPWLLLAVPVVSLSP